MSERDFQKQVVDLAKVAGFKAYHTFDSRRSEAGFPDLVLVGRGRVLFRELKTETGTLSHAQKAWLEALRLAGADAEVWRPSDWDEIQATLTKRKAK